MAGQANMKSDIDKLIQKHEGLLESWKAHRSKPDENRPNTQHEPEKKLLSKAS